MTREKIRNLVMYDTIATVCLCLCGLLLLYIYPRSSLVASGLSHNTTYNSSQNVVLLVVDGLSSRFTMRRSEDSMNQTFPRQNVSYLDKMDFFSDTSKHNPDTTIHKKSSVTTPTWTLDRITSLVTGGYPSHSMIDMLTSLKHYDTILTYNEGYRYYYVGDVIWKNIIEQNPNVRFIRKEYFNYFSMVEDQGSDERIVNRTIEVGRINLGYTGRQQVRFSVGSFFGVGP